jgi:DNA-binding CsgD family transcriptional regulator
MTTPFMRIIRPEQVWQLEASGYRDLQNFRVDRVDERLAHGVILARDGTPSKPHAFSLRTLRRGLRHATIVSEAPGYPEQRPTPESFAAPSAEKTAGDYRRARAPKGVVSASPRMEEAARLRSEGLTNKQIAARFGLATSSVTKMLTRYKEARTDAAIFGYREHAPRHVRRASDGAVGLVLREDPTVYLVDHAGATLRWHKSTCTLVDGDDRRTA